MRTHQKFLPGARARRACCRTSSRSWTTREDRKGFIAKGNEWVLNARLADARFFFEEDVARDVSRRGCRSSRG